MNYNKSDDSFWDEVRYKMEQAEEERVFKQIKAEKKIEPVVLICNRENKFKILNMDLPVPVCVLGTDACDDVIYMVTDKELAENIRARLIR